MVFALIAGLMLGARRRAVPPRLPVGGAEAKPSGAGILWMMPLAGLLTGVVAIWRAAGHGQRSRHRAVEFLLVRPIWPSSRCCCCLLCAKAIVTLLTIRSGASGGVLQPGIALGASGGAMLGILWMQMFHTNSIGMYALLGACALLAASQQAPLMAICLVMELGGCPD